MYRRKANSMDASGGPLRFLVSLGICVIALAGAWDSMSSINHSVYGKEGSSGDAGLRASTTLTMESTQSANSCVNSGSIASGFLFYHPSGWPSDKTWVVTIMFGLNGGDNTQNLILTFQLEDYTGSADIEVGQAGDAQNEWADQGNAYIATITAPINSQIDLSYDVSNALDTANQCYLLSATGGYY